MKNFSGVNKKKEKDHFSFFALLMKNLNDQYQDFQFSELRLDICSLVFVFPE